MVVMGAARLTSMHGNQWVNPLEFPPDHDKLASWRLEKSTDFAFFVEDITLLPFPAAPRKSIDCYWLK